MNIRASIIRYLLAMNASAVDSGVHALVLFCGLAGGHQITDSIPALTCQQLPWVFLVAFGRAVLSYLDKHPLADLLPKTPAA